MGLDSFFQIIRISKLLFFFFKKSGDGLFVFLEQLGKILFFKDGCPFQQISQFTDVAGEIIGHQRFDLFLATAMWIPTTPMSS